MKFVMQTADGNTIDTSDAKPITFNGEEFVMFKVIKSVRSFQPSQFENSVETNNSLEDFFNVTPTKRRKKRVVRKSISNKVRQWLDTKPKSGDTTNFESPTDYAIRVAAEARNCKVFIRRIRKGLYNVTFDSKKIYARSKTRT